MGNMIRRGIAAYQQTMQPQVETPKSASPPQDSAPVFLKTSTTLPVSPDDSKIRRVAKFLIVVGSDQAAAILGELDRQQVEVISREIASIQTIDPEEAAAVLAEFKSLFAVQRTSGYLGASAGGVEVARRILYAAYGPEKGEALLNKTVPESKENVFGFLEDFTPEQLVFLFKDESPAMAALVLARLPPKITADTIQQLPSALKPEILRKIARQNEVSPEVLERVAGALREKARHLLMARHLSMAGNLSVAGQDRAIDGMQALAAILKQGDYSFSDRIINELEMESPELGKNVKARIFTLDDVLIAHDRPLAEKLKTMTEQNIAILLKGRSTAFREKILSNVSSGRRQLIREEDEILGAVSKRDWNEAGNDFLAWFRLARERGELLLSNDEDWVV